MKAIDQFQAQLPHAIGDNLVLQRFFLHHLFPDTYALADLLAEREGYINQRSFKLVAADGFHWAASGVGRFTQGMDWLLSIDFPDALDFHEIALMGIAVGLAKTMQPIWLAWWKSLLSRIESQPDGYKLAKLLAVVSGLEAPEPSNLDLHEYDLAQGMLSRPQQWQAERIGAYFVKMRKEPFPYYVDFFRLMLAVYLMDCAITNALKSSEELGQIGKEAAVNQMAITEMSLDAFADKRARILLSTVALLGTISMLAACTLLFVWRQNYTEWRDVWDVLKWATLWVSGPIPAAALVLRILYFAIQHKPIPFDLQSLHKWYKERLKQRWRKRLNLPINL
jgi:hypothetical protein